MPTPAEQHPYFPSTLSLPSYVPPTEPVANTLAKFGIIFGTPVAIAWFLLSSRIPSKSRRLSALWFFTSLLFHVGFEGGWTIKSFLVWYYEGHGWGDKMSGGTTYMDNVLKEYVQADSRYFQDDTFILAVEIYTIVVLTVLALATFIAHIPSSGSPLSKSQFLRLHVLRIITSAIYITTTSLYLSTEIFRHHVDCRPEAKFAYAYFWGTNPPWIVVSIFLIKTSWNELAAAFEGKIKLN